MVGCGEDEVLARCHDDLALVSFGKQIESVERVAAVGELVFEEAVREVGVFAVDQRPVLIEPEGEGHALVVVSTGFDMRMSHGPMTFKRVKQRPSGNSGRIAVT